MAKHAHDHTLHEGASLAEAARMTLLILTTGLIALFGGILLLGVGGLI